jgi:pimeloyl-ACP methyl ester carboxylesterase
MRDGLETDRVRFVDVDGVRTRTYEAGDGEALVLIHGGGFGSLYSLDAWSLNLPALAQWFRVLTWDKLGQGHTDAPRSDGDYTFEALLAHALALLDGLDVGPAHLVGHSMGGLLATRIALDRPALVRTLTIVDSNTTAPDDPRHPWTAFYVDLAKRMPPGAPTRASVRLEPDAQSYSRRHVTDDWVDRLLEIARLPAHVEAAERVGAVREQTWMPSILAARARVLADVDARGLRTPTQVVWGADDVSAPLPLAFALFDRLRTRCEELELHVLARAGHYCFREQPRAFERLVVGFAHGRSSPGGATRES